MNQATDQSINQAIKQRRSGGSVGPVGNAGAAATATEAAALGAWGICGRTASVTIELEEFTEWALQKQMGSETNEE